MTQVLTDIATAVAALAERVGPSVVGIGRGWGRGSGVVVAPGRVLTSAHVLRGQEAAVMLGGDATPAEVAGLDPGRDLAVLAADLDAPAIAWGDPSELRLGAPVVALADPGGRGLRATVGFVSSGPRSFRRIRGLIEHTAPLPRGSSGGPLVDLDGRLLGINTVRLDGGLILALPADRALRERVAALGRGEATARPRLGVAIAPPRAARRIRAAAGLPERDGLLVRAVLDGSPAAAAGLRRGDLITRAGDRPLRGLDDLLDALEGTPDAVGLGVERGGEDTEIRVALHEVK